MENSEFPQRFWGFSPDIGKICDFCATSETFPKPDQMFPKIGRLEKDNIYRLCIISSDIRLKG